MYTETNIKSKLEVVTAIGIQSNPNYKVFRDHYYFPASTPDAVIAAIMNAYEQKARIRIFHGSTDPQNPKYGQVWTEVYDVMGYVGFTSGAIHSPILLPNKRSIGGGLIMLDSVLRIVGTTNCTLYYEHQSIRFPTLLVKGAKVYNVPDGEQMFLQLDCPASAKAYADAQNANPDNHAYFYPSSFDPSYVWKMVPEEAPLYDFSMDDNGEAKAQRMKDFLLGRRNNY